MTPVGISCGGSVRSGTSGVRKLGVHPLDVPRRFEGRHVDLYMPLVKDVEPGDDPVTAVQGYLRSAATTTAWHLSQKAVVVVDPPELLGKVIWNNRSAELDPGWDA